MKAGKLKIASEEERKLFCERIYPLQDKILRAISEDYGSLIFLSGGTALSRFYLHHRLSEDIDLFTKLPEKISSIARRIAFLLEKNGLKVELEYASPSFARLWIENLKVEIITEFNHLGRTIRVKEGFFIDNLANIGVNKITAFEDRAEMKDLIDLYFLSRKLRLERLLKLADMKREPVPYGELLSINQFGIAGEALLTVNIDEKELASFIRKLKGIIENNVKKKADEIEVSAIVRKILWDFPEERRKLSRETLPVIMRRLRSLPHKIAIERKIRERGELKIWESSINSRSMEKARS